MHIGWLLTMIPDVVWAALLASGLTLLGVLLSNKSNRTQLLDKLAHDSREKDKDRLNTLRKDVYLNASEEMAKANSYLGKIPQLDLAKENVGDGLSAFFGASAKLQLVSEPKTAELASDLTTRYGKILLKLLAKASPIHRLKSNIRIAGDFYDQNQAEVARILAEMKHLNESGQPDSVRFAALQRSIGQAQQNAKYFAEERSKAFDAHNLALRDYTVGLLEEVRSIGPLQLRLAAAIRGELSLATDLNEYEARLQANLDRMDKAIRDSLRKFEED